MSLLKKTRKRAAEVLWSRAGHLGSAIQQLIQEESGIGKTGIQNFGVAQTDRELGDAVVEALNLEGFYATWQDEGKRNIQVSWRVRHPRG